MSKLLVIYYVKLDWIFGRTKHKIDWQIQLQMHNKHKLD